MVTSTALGLPNNNSNSNRSRYLRGLVLWLGNLNLTLNYIREEILLVLLTNSLTILGSYLTHIKRFPLQMLKTNQLFRPKWRRPYLS